MDGCVCGRMDRRRCEQAFTEQAWAVGLREARAAVLIQGKRYREGACILIHTLLS